MRGILVAIALVHLAVPAHAGQATVPATQDGRHGPEKPYAIRRRAGADWLVRPDGGR